MLWVGMNIHCFDKQLMTTRMEVNPEDGGSCSMESIDMEFHGFLGMGSCFNKLKGVMPQNLRASAGSAGRDVVLYIGTYTGPSILAANTIQGPVLTEMSGDGMIVLVLKNLEPEVVRFGHEDMTI